MKYVELTDFGLPWEVCHTVDGPDLAPPSAGEINIRVEAGPINPAELLLTEGKYASKPPLPVCLGIEGVGIVAAIGDRVSSVAVGDRVMSLGRTNWAEEICLPELSVIKLANDVDVLQLSMLKVNPATALLMLERYVDLKPGDWVIQNAANSAVGYYLIELAKARGIHTANVVRRPELGEQLRGVGADLVFVEGDDLAEQVRAEIGDASMPLAIDAVGGKSCLNLGASLSDGGTIVNYGLLSGEPCQVGSDMTIFKNITLTGFWLAKLMGQMSRDELEAMYAQLSAKIADGSVHAPIAACYDLDHLDEALRHAYQSGRDGKVMITPNGTPS